MVSNCRGFLVVAMLSCFVVVVFFSLRFLNFDFVHNKVNIKKGKRSSPLDLTLGLSIRGVANCMPKQNCVPEKY